MVNMECEKYNGIESREKLRKLIDRLELKSIENFSYFLNLYYEFLVLEGKY